MYERGYRDAQATHSDLCLLDGSDAAAAAPPRGGRALVARALGTCEKVEVCMSEETETSA